MAGEEAARAQMVRRLKQSGAVATPAVEQALLRVPRHLFVPQMEGWSAYLDEAVLVKHTGGVAISSLSQPTIVAIMLERLEVSRGDRVLEVGTGTGYNAALLSVLAGATGYVASIELEPDLAEQAARTLALAGFGEVDVRVGDGSGGYPAHAPYDRVIVTTGARAVAEAWIAQLAEGGRLVVPIVDRRGRGVIVTLEERAGELLHSTGAPCGFVPLRHSPA